MNAGVELQAGLNFSSFLFEGQKETKNLGTN
jgi:hypothetical protein